MGQGHDRGVSPAGVALGAVEGSVAAQEEPASVSDVPYQGDGGGPPEAVRTALGHWTDDDAESLKRRMGNAHRAIAGRATENADAARISGITTGAELLVQSVLSGNAEAMRAGGRRAASAVAAGGHLHDELRARGESLAVQSQAETANGTAAQAEVAAQIADPEERERALTLLRSIDRSRQAARTTSAAAQIDARSENTRDIILGNVSATEARWSRSAGRLPELEGTSPKDAARILAELDGPVALEYARSLPDDQREHLAQIAEHTTDPLRSVAFRQASLRGTVPLSPDEWLARRDLTNAGLGVVAGRLLGLDLGGEAQAQEAMTDLTGSEVARRTGVDIDNESEHMEGGILPSLPAGWTPQALRQVEDTLLRVPAEHREAARRVNRFPHPPIKSISGWASGDEWKEQAGVTLAESAFDDLRGRFSREDHLAARQSAPSWLEEVTAHEVGHRVSHRLRPIANRLAAAAGWSGGGLTPGALPAGRHWGYAATNKDEHFAEMYAAAVTAPSMLHNEFRQAPEEEVRSRREQLHSLVQDAASPAELDRARRDLVQAERVQTSRSEQWRIMREEVFGVNNAQVAQRAAALRTQAPDADDGDAIAGEFSREAEKVMTPHQLDALQRRYQARLGSRR